MSPVVFVADIKTKSKEARDQALELLFKVNENAKSNESGTTRYLICLPVDTSDETSIYMVEGYVSLEAQVIHRKAGPTDALFKAFAAGLLAAPVTSYTLPPAASFQRAGLAAPPSGAVIVLTTFGYQPGKTSLALDGWKALVAHAEEKEKGALAVDILEDEKGSKVHTVQVFDSVESADAHVNGEAIKANREQNGNLRTGERNIVRVKIANGYLAK